MRTIAYSEIEGYAIANLVAKIENGLLDTAPIWSNIKTFPWAEFRGKVSILSGGYPCQPFSSAGKRKGTEDPRHLWPFIANGIRLMQPSVCFFENVEGHISLGLREVISELEEIGYTTTWGIFSASEVGAPHRRKRIFILGYSKHHGHITSEISRRVSERIQAQTKQNQSMQSEGSSICGGGQQCLAYTKGSESGESSEWQGGQDIRRGSKENMAHTNSGGLTSEQHTRGSTKENSRRESDTQSSNTDVAYRNGEGLEGHRGFIEHEVWSNAWPSGPRSAQKDWEPPRVLGNTSSEGRTRGNECESVVGSEKIESVTQSDVFCEEQGQYKIKSTLGRELNGDTDWVDYANLCESYDNRTDELRLLGNGVVPATATLGFQILTQRLSQ
jgi:DNA (cytosine-5)-methyltransferase 1